LIACASGAWAQNRPSNARSKGGRVGNRADEPRQVAVQKLNDATDSSTSSLVPFCKGRVAAKNCQGPANGPRRGHALRSGRGRLCSESGYRSTTTRGTWRSGKGHRARQGHRRQHCYGARDANACGCLQQKPRSYRGGDGMSGYRQRQGPRYRDDRRGTCAVMQQRPRGIGAFDRGRTHGRQLRKSGRNGPRGAWRRSSNGQRFHACIWQGEGVGQRGSSAAVESLTEAEKDALRAALLDEYNAEAYYSSVLDKFGSSRRLENIRRAEQRHAQTLLALFERYGVAPPERDAVDAPAVPETLQSAMQHAADVEVKNVDLYDELIEAAGHEDIRSVFERLRDASLNHHLPALQRGR
jgi:rubrerythrin